MMLDVILASFTALVAVVAFLRFVAANKPSEMRNILLEMIDAKCPNCDVEIDYNQLVKGEDCLSTEVHVTDENQRRHLTSRRVQCGHCGADFVIRLNEQGDQFGPRLSVKLSERDQSTDVITPNALDMH